MNVPSTAALLNHLLAIVGRSFPQYLQYSRPYIPPGRSDVVETIQAIAVDQDGLADRITLMLREAEAPIHAGDFPMEYTDVHDLGIDYLVGMAVEYQQQDVQLISDLVEQLQASPAAKSLTEEALGMAKGHLESLKELTAAETNAG